MIGYAVSLTSMFFFRLFGGGGGGVDPNMVVVEAGDSGGTVTSYPSMVTPIVVPGDESGTVTN